MSTQPVFCTRLVWGKQHYILLLLLLHVIIGTGQISVTIHLPPPGKFGPDDFLNSLSFHNHTGQTKQVYLVATVEEQTAGLIYSGTSAVFELMPGFSSPHYSVYDPVETDYIHAGYESFIVHTNTLPSGDYVICIWVRDVLTGDQLGRTCVPYHLFHPSAPVLVYPSEGAHLSEPHPMFVWLPPAPLPAVEVKYSVTIAEVFPGQTPYEAITSNPAFVQEMGIAGTTWLYGMHYPPMVTGRQYVWQVQAHTAEGLPVGQNNGFSEVGMFTTGTAVERSIIPVSPMGACTGVVTAMVMAQSVPFNWLVSGEFTSFSVIIYDNPCGRYPTPPRVPDDPTPPVTRPPSVPTGPGQTPGPPGTTPSDTVKVVPVDTLEKKPGTTETTLWKPDPEEEAPGEVPVDTADTADPDWPEGDDDHDYRPPLPPGWAWGPGGCYWTGEHPPTPPALPPGWDWGPLRPYWKGEGATPPERTILYVSKPVESLPLDFPDFMQEMMFQKMVPLHQILEPGQAFIYQIYGTYQTHDGQMQGYLSEPQCVRYSATVSGTDTAEPVSCKVCVARIEPRAGPAMNGGLDPPKDTLEIYRDDFIVLKAEGADYDQIWWFCTPSPDCPETPSTDMRVTSSRVKFTWEIMEGDGDFTEIGCAGRKSATEGDRVIFMPPYVKPDTVLETKIKLSIIDDNPSQPLDETVERIISIKMERTRKEPHKYHIIIDSEEYKLPQPTEITGLRRGTCRTRGPVWTKDENLTKPEIRLPGEQDADKLVYKELIRLYADDIRDPDNIKVWCLSAQCDTMAINRDFEDEVEFTWSINKGGGSFIKGNKGRFVIYEAPEKEGEVEILIEVGNPGYSKISDKKPEPGKITLKVFQPGIRMEQTPLRWLPEAGNILQKRSYLVYKEGNEWKDALDHQCRIHFVELMDISNEPGICLNWPPKNHETTYLVDTCKDLILKDTTLYELFDTVACRRWKYDDTLWYIKGNTLLPEKEFTFQILSFDYGGYGFVRSLANGDQSTAKPYYSVPWTKQEKVHPTRPEDTKPEAADNRVTIPRDNDENQIADWGWQTTLQKKFSANITNMVSFLVIELKENDPKDPARDTDSVPRSNFPGDGISAYEEYRGFSIKGDHHGHKHERFSMGIKDLLIWDRDNIGLGYFPSSNIQCWRISFNEMDTGRVINLNRKTHQLGFDQKGIRLYRNDVFANVLGRAVNSVNRDGLVTCDSVLVNVARHAGGADLSNTIAHELSHAVGVRHHGEGIIRGWLAPSVPGDTFFVMVDSVNIWVINDTARVNIACRGGLTSGDTACWMRYDRFIIYCPVTQSLRNLNCTENTYSSNLRNRAIRTVNDRHAGRNITNNRNGTGINANNQCGCNAGTNCGNCIDQIRISCRRP